MSSYIFYDHSYHLESNQLLSFKICFSPCVCVCVWAFVCERASFWPSIQNDRLGRGLYPPHPSPYLSIPSHSSPSLSSPSRPYVIYLHQISPSLASLHFPTFFCLFNPPFTPFQMTRNVHTLRHLSGAVVARQHCFLLPKQKKDREPMIYSIKRERKRVEKDIERRW